MFYAEISREQTLALFPKGGRWCEVGVFSGAFSRQIVETVTPEELHLVDVWKWIYYDWNDPPASELDNIEHFKVWMKTQVADYDGGHPDRFLDRFFQDLANWSSTEARSAIMLHRGLSVEAAKQLPDGHFNAIYLDADHHYDTVLADLFAYAPKLDSGGIIMGDDFLEDLTRRDGLYGTIDAVNTFTKRTGFKCLVVTGFGASQFLLYKVMSDYVDAFLSNLLNSGSFIIELNDVLLSRYVQKTIATARTRRNVPSFS